MPQALLDYLAPKKILLLGFGREGRSTYQYIRRHFPEKELSIDVYKRQRPRCIHFRYLL